MRRWWIHMWSEWDRRAAQNERKGTSAIKQQHRRHFVALWQFLKIKARLISPENCRSVTSPPFHLPSSSFSLFVNRFLSFPLSFLFFLLSFLHFTKNICRLHTSMNLSNFRTFSPTKKKKEKKKKRRRKKRKIKLKLDASVRIWVF